MVHEPFVACSSSRTHSGVASTLVRAALVTSILTPAGSLTHELISEKLKAPGNPWNGGAELEQRPRKKPIVYLQELWTMFPDFEMPEHATLYSMDTLYNEPHCAGSHGFISKDLNVPSEYCRTPERVPRMLRGNNEQFDERKATAYDEFLLERVLLARWRSSDLRCSPKGHGADWCKQNADVVIVPSVELHSMVSESFSLRAAYRYAIHKMDIASYVPGIHENFWERLRDDFYKPEENYTPLVVVATSITNLLAPAMGLATMPLGFQGRVMFISPETNTPAASFYPAPWQPSHESWAMKKADSPYFITMPVPNSLHRVVNFVDSSEGYDASKTRPIAISMQLGIHKHPQRRTKSSEDSAWLENMLLEGIETHGGKDGLLCHEAKNANGHGPDDICGLGDTRTMWGQTVSTAFCLEIPKENQSIRSHLYVAVLSGCIPVIFDEFQEAGPTHWAWRSPESESSRHLPIEAGDSVVVEPDKERLIASFAEHRVNYHDKMEGMLGNEFVVGEVVDKSLIGLPSIDGSQLGKWYFPVEAVSLTRKAHAANPTNRQTPFLDYRDFAVIFDAREVRDGGVDVIGELLRILETPSRLDALRRGGKRAAPMFRYALNCPEGCHDAFTNLETLLTAAAGFPVNGFPLPE